jgi:hypothetical protein
MKPHDIERTLPSTDPRDHYRLVVRQGRGPIIELGEEDLSLSGHVTDRRLFLVGVKNAAWLQGAIGEVLAAIHEEKRQEVEELAAERDKLRAACEMALKTQMHPASKESVALREALEGGDGKVVRLKAGKR